MEKIYAINEGRLKQIEVASPAKIDGHLHSEYSGKLPDIFLQSRFTRWTGVRESYTNLDTVYEKLNANGMTFHTLSDHDSVIGALKLRLKHPETTLVNCEYTVNVGNEGLIVHVGGWGIDYPGDATKPLSVRETLELHDELVHAGEKGYEAFILFCEKVGVAYALNHPAWQNNSRKSLSGRQLDDITDAFPVLEINGDMGIENLVTLEVALNKNKTLCAGSDAHTAQRIGRTFTTTLTPATTPAEFMREFKKGNIGIGSTYKLPQEASTPLEIMRYKFNGTFKDLNHDIYSNTFNYLLKDWGYRKWITLLVTIGAQAGILALDPLIAGPPLLLAEVLAITSIPPGMAIIEKKNNAERAKKLYKDYHEYLAERATAREREFLEKLEGKIERVEHFHNELVKDFENMEHTPKQSMWERIVYRIFHPFSIFNPDYDLSKNKKSTGASILEKEIEE